MSSLLFYLIVLVILIAGWFLFIKRRRKKNNNYRIQRQTPVLQEDTLVLVDSDDQKLLANSKIGIDQIKYSPYDPNLIVFKIKAFPGRPYMGYELHQALLAADLNFDDEGIFHRYAGSNRNNILFSLAAATATGKIAIENLGRFKCAGLLIFMYLENKKKLMASFDLMLDTARQLCEELGGEIYDDLEQLINASAIKRQRKRICMIETGNLYNADLLDNLD